MERRKFSEEDRKRMLLDIFNRQKKGEKVSDLVKEHGLSVSSYNSMRQRERKKNPKLYSEGSVQVVTYPSQKVAVKRGRRVENKVPFPLTDRKMFLVIGSLEELTALIKGASL